MKYIIQKKIEKPTKTKFSTTEIEDIFEQFGIEKHEGDGKEFKHRLTANVCKKVINVKQIHSYFDKGIVIYSENELQEIDGLVIFSMTKEFIEIQILCATKKGLGKILLDKIKEIGRNATLSYIVLTPALKFKLLEYYYREGFIEDDEHPSQMVFYL
jgi:hypothetical protein